MNAIFSREKEDLKVVEGDFGFSALADAPLQIEPDGNDGYKLLIPIGTEAPIYCFVSENINTPDAYLKEIFDKIRSNQAIQKSSIGSIRSDLISNYPFLFLDIQYLTKNRLYGRVKTLAISTLNVSAYCLHDEAGYYKTFSNVLASLFRSEYFLEHKKRSKEKYQSHQIDAMMLNGTPVGFMETYTRRKDDTHIQNLVFQSMLFVQKGNRIIPENSLYNITSLASTGELEHAEYFSYHDNQSRYEIELGKTDTNTYKVKGKLGKEEIQKTLNTRSPLLNDSLYVLSRIQSSLPIENDTKFVTYSPASPLEATDVTIESFRDNKGLYSVKMDVGHMKMDYLYDTKSHLAIKADLGVMNLMIKRLLLETDETDEAPAP